MPQDISNTAAPWPQHLWTTRCAAPSATAIAIEQRWLHAEFEPDGIRVATLQQTDEAQLQIQPVYRDLSGVFHEGGNIPALWARANGLANTAVIGLTWVDEYQVLLSRPQEGLIGPGSLVGKRLGLPRMTLPRNGSSDVRRTGALRAYLSTLELAGAGSNDVKFIDIDASECVGKNRDAQQWNAVWLQAGIAALLSGHIDVLYATGAIAKKAKRAFALEVTFDISASNNLCTRINSETLRPLTVDRDFLVAHPDLVARYLAVLLQTARWAALHPKAVRRLLATHLQTDSTSLLNSYGRYLNCHLHPQLTPTLVKAFVAQKQFLLDWNLIPADFDMTRWIDPRPLLQAQRLMASGALPLLPRVAA